MQFPSDFYGCVFNLSAGFCEGHNYRDHWNLNSELACPEVKGTSATVLFTLPAFVQLTGCRGCRMRRCGAPTRSPQETGTECPASTAITTRSSSASQSICCDWSGVSPKPHAPWHCGISVRHPSKRSGSSSPYMGSVVDETSAAESQENARVFLRSFCDGLLVSMRDSGPDRLLSGAPVRADS